MELFVIFDCNAWKERSSFRLIMVSDKEQLSDNLEAIKKDHGYTDEEMETYIFVEEVTLNKVA